MEDVFGEFSGNVVDGAAEAAVQQSVNGLIPSPNRKDKPRQPQRPDGAAREANASAQAAEKPSVQAEDNTPPPVEIVNDIPGFEDCRISQATKAVVINVGVAGAMGGAINLTEKAITSQIAKNAAQAVGKQITSTAVKEGSKILGRTAVKSIPVVGAIAGVGMDFMTLKDELSQVSEWQEQTGGKATFFGNPAYREAVTEAGLKFAGNFALNVVSGALSATVFGPALLNFCVSPLLNSAFIANDIANPDLIQMNSLLTNTMKEGGGLSMNLVADATIKAAKVSGNMELAMDLDRMRMNKDPAFVYTINAVARDMVNNRNPGGTLKMMCEKGEDGHCELAAIAQEVRNELARNQEMQQAIAGAGKDAPNLQSSDGIANGVGGRALTPEEMSAMRVALQSATNGFPPGTIAEHVEDGLSSRGVTPTGGSMVARATRPRGNPVNSI